MNQQDLHRVKFVISLKIKNANTILPTGPHVGILPIHPYIYVTCMFIIANLLSNHEVKTKQITVQSANITSFQSIKRMRQLSIFVQRENPGVEWYMYYTKICIKITEKILVCVFT